MGDRTNWGTRFGHSGSARAAPPVRRRRRRVGAWATGWQSSYLLGGQNGLNSRSTSVTSRRMLTSTATSNAQPGTIKLMPLSTLKRGLRASSPSQIRRAPFRAQRHSPPALAAVRAAPWWPQQLGHDRTPEQREDRQQPAAPRRQRQREELRKGRSGALAKSSMGQSMGAP